MSSHDGVLLVVAAVLVLLAGLFAGAEAAFSSYSKVRANEQVEQGNLRAVKLRDLLSDAPRYLNSLLLIRLSCEITAIVLVTQALSNVFSVTWTHVLITAVLMVLISYVVIGVAPRTLGRQHSDRFAIVSAGPIMALTRVLGPLPKLLILIGNALTPGKGFAEGPFATEAELRALVDLAEKSSVIEKTERQMIHSVFEARRHHRPRGDGAADRHGLHREAQEAAPAHLAGPTQRLFADPGDRRVAGRHPRRRLPQGRDAPGLRQRLGRVDRAGRVGDAPVHVHSGLQAGRPVAARDAGGPDARRDRRRRVRRYGRPGHHRGHPGGDRRRDHRRVRRGAGGGASAVRRGLPGLQPVPDRRASATCSAYRWTTTTSTRSVG